MTDVVSQLLVKEKWMIVSGAGVSADSGVPTYRDKNGLWQRRPPVTHQDFMNDPGARQRFWSRNMVGWRFMVEAKPNASHHTLVKLEKVGLISCLVTQNVDGLHQLAGSRYVIDLHGRINTVSCTSCFAVVSRADLQYWLELNNSHYANLVGTILPDGDAGIDDIDFSSINVPVCQKCGGILKPDVVFFGDSIPKQRVANVSAELLLADGLLILGSSLMTYSGYRICLQAAKIGKPIVIVNQGITRADDIARVKSEESCEVVLKRWLEKAL